MSSDDRVFSSEAEAIDHNRWVPLIEESRKMLNQYFDGQSTISLDELSSELVETDLAARIAILFYSKINGGCTI